VGRRKIAVYFAIRAGGVGGSSLFRGLLVLIPARIEESLLIGLFDDEIVLPDVRLNSGRCSARSASAA
jgi:hypothetical protein